MKVGAKNAPAFILVVYYALIGFDIFTTYLASPDLGFEVNWVIQVFNMSWKQIILSSYLFAAMISILYLTSLGRLITQFKNIPYNKQKSTVRLVIMDKKLCLNYLVFVIFFTHFLGSIFVIINNLLNYFYLRKIGGLLYFIAFKYVSFETVFYPYYYIYTQSIVLLIAIIYSVVKINKIKQSSSSTRNPILV
jgi:hypothetical protein